MPYKPKFYTVVETPLYSRKAERLLSEQEREEFAAFISRHPKAGPVVKGTGGIRKVRWVREGSGKRSGVRVIYYNQYVQQEVWLLTLYAKNDRATIPAHELNLIREAIERE